MLLSYTMKIEFYLSILSVVCSATAAYVPSQPWSTLTPTATLDSKASATADFDGSFALSVKTLSTNSAAVSAASKAGVAKRDDDLVGQLTDGQPQQNSKGGHKTAPPKPTKSVVNQITDGQVQQQTKTTAAVVNQIGDGQVQQQHTTAAVVNQIGDGQVQQHTTAAVVNQIGDGQVQQQLPKKTASVVNQIGDGQVQQQTKAHKTASVADQIGDGQVQQHTKAPEHKSVADQLGDGQVQHKTKAGQVSQVGDGQAQATSGSSSDDEAVSDSGFEETCLSSDSLTLSLKGGVLKDSKGRIGSIVANRQFQFDGPPPQAGAIYAAGWSIAPLDYKEDKETKKQADDEKKPDSKDSKKDSKKDAKKDSKKDKKDKRDDAKWGKLALGKQTTFYKCLSGDFYNLYDESIGSQCSEVELVVLKAVDC